MDRMTTERDCSEMLVVAMLPPLHVRERIYLQIENNSAQYERFIVGVRLTPHTGMDLFGFGLSIPSQRDCRVRLQRRQLVEHDREIAGAGDILLDDVVVSFESIWHTLTTDLLMNVIFIEWNKSDLCYTKLASAAHSLSPSLLFAGKYPTSAFPAGTQYGVEVSAIRSSSSNVPASLQFPADSGCYWCSLTVADSKWMTLKMTASFDMEHCSRTVVIRESSSANRLLRPVANFGHCSVLYAVWTDCTPVFTGIKYSQVAVDEPGSTPEPQTPHNYENRCSNCEQVVNRLPDIVRDVEGYLPSDGSFVRGISVDVGKVAEATWSKEVLSSGGIPEDELASTEPDSYWNSNSKECSDGMIVTLNASYENESDASSQSSLDDQFEGFSSVDDGCSKGQSSVAEPADLSDTELSVLAGKETAGSLEALDGNVEQVLTEPRDSFLTGQGMENATGTVTTSHMENQEIIEEMSQPTCVPPVELSSECCIVAGGEILRELDAYLNSALDDYPSADDDSLHVTTATAAATDDDVMKNGFCSRDIINVDGLAADLNDVEHIDEADLDQTESVTVHSSVEVPASRPVINVFRDAVEVCDNNTSQVDNNNNVCVEANQLCGADNTASFLRNQTVMSIRQQLQQDFNTDKTDKVHEEAAAEDVPDSIDLSESEKSSESPKELPKFKTYDDTVPSDCYSKVETTELVGNDVEMADAEVDAIFSGAVCGLCIRRVSDDEADASDPRDSCVQLSQTSDTSDTDDFTRCGVTCSVPVKERLELDTENDMPATNETGTSEATGINLPCECSSEAPDIEYQFERNGDGQDTQVEQDRKIRNRELQINDYIVDECETESDQSSNDLEITLPAEPSDKVREMWNEDEDEIANSEVDTKPKTDEGRQEDDQAAAADCVSSPGSDMSWRSCTSTVCKSENHTEENNELETVPSVRGVTPSQVAAYSKFCEGRLNVTVPVDYSDKTVNTVPNEQQDEDYTNAYDNEIPPENLDSWVQHQLLNSISLLSEYHHYDFSGTESCVLQNKYAQMKVKKNETVEESFPVDEDLEEVNECSRDTVLDTDVTVTNLASECSSQFSDAK